MDNLTHSLFGAVLARAGLARERGPGATALLVVASNIPDVDALLMLTHGEASAWLRRTHTHCVLGAPLLAVALGLAWWLGTRRGMRLRDALMLASAGVGGHVAMDLLNSYGVVALWPFTPERFELAWVFIIDLAIWGLLLAPFAIAPLVARRVRSATVHRIALVGLAIHVGLCAAGRWRASEVIDDVLVREGIDADFRYVFPEALGNHRWRAVAREGDTWRMWLVHVLDGRVELSHVVQADESDPRVVRARQSERGRRVDGFFKAPVWQLGEEGATVTCTDLRFLSLVLPRRSGVFEMTFPATAAEHEH